jgi:hypothetical protein
MKARRSDSVKGCCRISSILTELIYDGARPNVIGKLLKQLIPSRRDGPTPLKRGVNERRTWFVESAVIAVTLLFVFEADMTWAATNEVPNDWVDSATGRRIIRLSSEGGSTSLYFHQNSYTPEGDKLIFDTPEGIGAVDLKTLGTRPPKVDIVVIRGRLRSLRMGCGSICFGRRRTAAL